MKFNLNNSSDNTDIYIYKYTREAVKSGAFRGSGRRSRVGSGQGSEWPDPTSQISSTSCDPIRLDPRESERIPTRPALVGS